MRVLLVGLILRDPFLFGLRITSLVSSIFFLPFVLCFIRLYHYFWLWIYLIVLSFHGISISLSRNKSKILWNSVLFFLLLLLSLKSIDLLGSFGYIFPSRWFLPILLVCFSLFVFSINHTKPNRVFYRFFLAFTFQTEVFLFHFLCLLCGKVNSLSDFFYFSVHYLCVV